MWFELIAQILPLIVFIIVDSLYNNIKVSIISAVICAIAVLLFFYLKSGVVEWFIILDMCLILGLGLIAIFLKNDMFFMVKPAIVDVTVIVFLFVLFFSSDSFLLDYFNRFMPKGRKFDYTMVGMIKSLLLIMSLYGLAHIGAVLYTAKFSSRKLWAFIAGPGQFFLFIPVMIYVLVKRMKMKRLRK